MFLFGWVILGKNGVGVKFMPYADYFLDQIIYGDEPSKDVLIKWDKLNPENSPHRIQELYINE